MHKDRAELLPYVPDLRKDKWGGGGKKGGGVHIWISKWSVTSVIVRGRFDAIGGCLAILGVFMRLSAALPTGW